MCLVCKAFFPNIILFIETIIKEYCIMVALNETTLTYQVNYLASKGYTFKQIRSLLKPLIPKHRLPTEKAMFKYNFKIKQFLKHKLI